MKNTSVLSAAAMRGMARMRIILVLLTVIALAMTGCDDGNGNSTHVHQWGAWNVTTPATCIATGSQTRTCALDATHTETQEIAIDLVNGHDWDFDNATETLAPTCTTPGDGTIDCKRKATCGGTRSGAGQIPIDPSAHNYQQSSTATETEDGEAGMICTYNSLHIQGSTTIAYATGTAGLAYAGIPNNNNPTAYRVSRGTATTATAIHIPAYYRPNATSPYQPVTQIGNGTNTSASNAFGGTSDTDPNTTVTSITFAEGSQLATISNYAFYYCTSLTSITLPATVTSIGTYAFSQCSSLTSITIPAGVTSIGNNAFGSAATWESPMGLQTVTFAAGSQLQTIGEWAFYKCNALTNISIPATVTTIGTYAFSQCSGLTGSITIPAGVTSIRSGAFSQCWGLTSITIPEGVTSIGTSAFYYCSGLTSITIPASVTSIDFNAFANCDGLVSVTFLGTITAANAINDNAFDAIGDLRLKYLAGGIGGAGTYTRTPPLNGNSQWTKQ